MQVLYPQEYLATPVIILNNPCRLDFCGRNLYHCCMDIKTYIRPKNVKTATKILRKGRGAWGDFVNKALEDYADPRTEAERIGQAMNESFVRHQQKGS